MNKINKELVLAIVVMLSLLIGCSILQSLDDEPPRPFDEYYDPYEGEGLYYD